MVTPTTIPIPSEKIIDPRTGDMSRTWRLFFLNLFNLVGGGSSTITIPDTQIAPLPSDSSEELTALGQEIGTAPAYVAIFPQDDPLPAAPFSASAFDWLAPAVQLGTLAAKNSDQIVSTISFGSTGLTPATATSGEVSVAGALITSNGGTGLTTYTAGDLVYYASGTTFTKLGIGTNNYVLTSTGSAPQWSQNTGTGNVARASQPQFTSTIGVGTSASGSGSGVSFPATQSPSTDANTLDDYEEGTWTPTVTATTGSITSYSASGTYTKIGRQVFCTATIDITNNGTGAAVLQYTLPFTASGAWCGTGRETSVGTMLQVVSAASVASVLTYLNAYPAATGFQLICTLSYNV